MFFLWTNNFYLVNLIHFTDNLDAEDVRSVIEHKQAALNGLESYDISRPSPFKSSWYF